MAELLNSELALASISDKESKGYKVSVMEIELPESDTPYVGTSNGLYKVIDYTNAKGKGLLILACGTIEFNGNTVEFDMPIAKSKVGMFNDKQEVQFTVTRKTPTDPKRVKFIGLSDDVTVNDNELPDDLKALKAIYSERANKPYEGTNNKSSVKKAILAL